MLEKSILYIHVYKCIKAPQHNTSKTLHKVVCKRCKKLSCNVFSVYTSIYIALISWLNLVLKHHIQVKKPEQSGTIFNL